MEIRIREKIPARVPHSSSREISYGKRKETAGKEKERRGKERDVSAWQGLVCLMKEKNEPNGPYISI